MKRNFLTTLKPIMSALVIVKGLLPIHLTAKPVFYCIHINNCNYMINQNEMTEEEKAAFLNALMKGVHIEQNNVILSQGNNVYYNQGDKEGSQPRQVYTVVEETAPSPRQADKDERMSRALNAVFRDRCFEHLYDWTWVKIAMEDERIGISFDKTPSYLSYLQTHIDTHLPDVSMLNKYLSKVTRDGETYRFLDTKDPKETIRRNNVIRRFISAFLK